MLTLPNATVQFSTVVSDLGLLIDGELTVANHIAALSRSCFFHMRQLRSIRHSLTSEAMLTLIQAFVSSRLDYCNSVLVAGVSSQLLQKMQVIQNAAAQFVMGTRRRDEMVLHELRWLPQRQRIKFKTAVMVYKCIHSEDETSDSPRLRQHPRGIPEEPEPQSSHLAVQILVQNHGYPFHPEDLEKGQGDSR